MGSFWILWVSFGSFGFLLGFCGFLWAPLGFFGFLCVLLGSFGFLGFLWVPLVSFRFFLIIWGSSGFLEVFAYDVTITHRLEINSIFSLVSYTTTYFFEPVTSPCYLWFWKLWTIMLFVFELSYRIF